MVLGSILLLVPSAFLILDVVDPHWLKRLVFNCAILRVHRNQPSLLFPVIQCKILTVTFSLMVVMDFFVSQALWHSCCSHSNINSKNVGCCVAQSCISLQLSTMLCNTKTKNIILIVASCNKSSLPWWLQPTAYKFLIVASSCLAIVDLLLSRCLLPCNTTASCKIKNMVVVFSLAIQHKKYDQRHRHFLQSTVYYVVGTYFVIPKQ